MSWAFGQLIRDVFCVWVYEFESHVGGGGGGWEERERERWDSYKHCGKENKNNKNDIFCD